MALQGYAEHHCPCHRKVDARGAGAVVADDDCEGKRFLIERIESPNLPGLVLYTETMTAEVLEASLFPIRSQPVGAS